MKEKTGSTFISATGATVNISGCEYSNNGSGFLVASTGSKVTVTDSTFKNNTMRAPTLWFTDQGATTGSFTVKNCTFTGNANTYSNVNYENSRGCAINSGCPGTTLIEDCTVTKNLSHGDGGGIYLYGKGTATIKNTTVEDNESQWHGGGIAVNSANAPVFTGTVVVKNNKSRIPYNAYYQDMTTVVTCNVMIGSIGSRCAITTDSGFNAGASYIGLSAWDIPSLVVSGNTSTKGFHADDKDHFVLRPTTDKSGPLLTSGNTGLELWHNGKGHTHCVCGTGENTADSTHTHEKLNWIGVTELKDLPAGNYYLLRGYSSSWAPTKDINLCLNGLGISSTAGKNAIIDVDDSNKVAVTDCNESKPGTITGSGWYARDVYVTSGSTFTLWNGKLTGYDYQSDSSYTIPNGGGVWMDSGKFIMNGGSISARSTSGHGGVVYMYGGTFIMNGGSLSGKALKGSGGAVYAKYGNFIMNGGTITGKAAETEKDNGSRGWAGHGGAVYGEYATININGGTITGSSAAEGGGIYAKKATLTIGKANITDNIAAHGGGGIHAYNSALTIDGATVTGNNGGESLGGGIYISGAKGKGTASDPYIPAVIQNATIQNNTAKCGGGINASGPVKISDTTITGNTATTLEKWGGGGLNARIIPKSSYGNGWVFELSGKMNITGNNAEEWSTTSISLK
ncbi:MAG: right-handed parallel beta-helix repeat-containing protein [Oscillospiraceae bacterium]